MKNKDLLYCHYKIGVMKELHKKGLLTKEQLEKAVDMLKYKGDKRA